MPSSEPAKAQEPPQRALVPDRWTNRALFRLMWPLLVEQLLAVSIGMVDTVMVAAVGEAAVSGVSLSDAINMLLNTALSALATGGAVVASQYLGRRDRVHASAAARQLVYVITLLSLIVMAVVLILCRPTLSFIYGNIDDAVMQNANTYLRLSALGYPFIALYNAGASLFRSMGNSRVGMFSLFAVNLLNIGGNFLLINVFGLGVAGAAISTLISRAVGSLVLIRLLLNVHAGPITLAGLFRFHISFPIIRQILRIGLPNGLENSMFQIGKLVVARMVSTFGTAAIASNAIAGSITTIATLPGQAFGLAMLTVVGQCVGSGNFAAARRNTKKLTISAMVGMAFVCLLILLLRTPLLVAFNLSADAVALGRTCLMLFCLAAPIFWPFSFALPNALRAAGDARYTMVVSMFSMWAFRIGSAWLLAIYFNMGVLGVWYAMLVDWVVRGSFFVPRWLSHTWEKHRLIG